MALRNPIFFWLVSLFIFLNCVDIITTIFILPGEANPVYHLTGSLWLVLAVKIFICYAAACFYYTNTFPTERSYHFILLVLVMSSTALLLAQINNIYAMAHPAMIAEAAALPTSEKVTGYFLFMGVVYLGPVLFSMLVFYLYDKSKGKARINFEAAKKVKWSTMLRWKRNE